jgi:toxin ParE1/3/4
MAEIIWTSTALSDINSIAEYISLDSGFYAKQFVNKIFLAPYKLEAQPEIGKIVPELPTYNYREIIFKKYRIIYRVDSDIVYIISVHHSSRLLGNNEHFKNLFE